MAASSFAVPSDITQTESGYHYDLVVIGGGSGGLACAKEAADLGKKVAMFDFVKPSPQGTKWGLGGTCVNVGCIPKKLMHYTANLGAQFHDAKQLGWQTEEPTHDWETMVSEINSYIKSLNYGYRVQLAEKNIEYYRALAHFIDDHTLGFTLRKKGNLQITAENIVIATGGRPHTLDIPGAELAITSDDIFWQQEAPGKTLCVGASYISLETAGFLNELGFETDVMVRSILLRGFDRECADLIGEHMEKVGVGFKYQSTPDRLDKLSNGKIRVTYTQDNVQLTEDYDTVIFATGRDADTSGLLLENAGVEAAANGKFDVENERTNVENIYAVGDVVNGRQELTPVAIQAGTLLARRLFTQDQSCMDYDLVPTTVFTPLEYGCCGLSEEDAMDKFGEENIDSYLTKFTALEQDAAHRLAKDGSPLTNPHFAKLVVHTGQQNRVVGFHYLGPHAGEITQGFALAVKLGATKQDFDNAVGIHPTAAEKFTTLHITKSSGQDFEATGC